MKTLHDFYVLEKPKAGGSKDRLAGTNIMAVAGFNVGEPTKCPACGSITSLLPWLPPYKVEIETWGREFGTLALWAQYLVVSASFKNLYEENELSGLLEFEPVEVARIKKHKRLVETIPNYFKANVVQSETAVDQEASGMEWDDGQLDCPVCLHRRGVFLRQQRLVIRAETWTGEDIFHARGGVSFVASKRFKEVCESHAVSNVDFVPAERYEKDYYPSESKILLKYLTMFEDREQSRERRQDAYRTFAKALGRGNLGELFKKDFDPDTEDPSVVEMVKMRLADEGLVVQQKGTGRTLGEEKGTA